MTRSYSRVIVAGLEGRVTARLATAGEGARARLHALVDAHVGLGDDADRTAVAMWAAVAAEAMRNPLVDGLLRA